MRILWLTNDFPPQIGGIEEFVANLARRVHPEQALVLTSAHRDAAGHDATVPHGVVRLDKKTLLPTPALLRTVRRAARDHGADVVVLGATWPLGELSRRIEVPVVALTHGLEAGLATVGLGRLVRRATRGTAAVTVISTYTERLLAPHLADVPVRRIPPGVDVEAFRPGRSGTALRERWDIPQAVPVVGCVSRLVARKGQDLLVRVWPSVRARVPDARLVLVGSGPLEQRLRRAATDGVVVAGPARGEELADAYAAFDVFAMPCRTRLRGVDVEGLGIVYLEAQASGIPVVAGRSGGAPETVLDGETGLVVDGRDPTAVADALVRLLSDRDERARMGAAGRAWAEHEWSWPAIAERFSTLLEEVATRPGRP
jgi:phosphatidyl-myo-inositol dimannoside synthase